MQEILWLEGYLPSTTGNYVANEVIVASRAQSPYARS